MVAAKAVAVSVPMPGIVTSFWLTALSRRNYRRSGLAVFPLSVKLSHG